MSGNSSQGLLIQMGNKALAEMRTPAAEDPQTRFYPTGVNHSRLLVWLGLVAAILIVLGLLWSLVFAH